MPYCIRDQITKDGYFVTPSFELNKNFHALFAHSQSKQVDKKNICRDRCKETRGHLQVKHLMFHAVSYTQLKRLHLYC